MLDILTAWRYTDSVSEARRVMLTAKGCFAELVSLAKEDVEGVCVRACSGKDPGLTDCIQPIFTLNLPKTGDSIFNGPWGYRAQYWISPFTGLTANATLIAALTPKLLAAVNLDAVPELGKIDICTSLRATSAKIWIQEIPSLLLNPTSDLDVSRWREEAQRGVQLARWGLSAPEVTRFEVKGALIDPNGNEVVPSRKILRHQDIHHYGFS